MTTAAYKPKIGSNTPHGIIFLLNIKKTDLTIVSIPQTPGPSKIHQDIEFKDEQQAGVPLAELLFPAEDQEETRSPCRAYLDRSRVDGKRKRLESIRDEGPMISEKKGNSS